MIEDNDNVKIAGFLLDNEQSLIEMLYNQCDKSRNNSCDYFEFHDWLTSHGDYTPSLAELRWAFDKSLILKEVLQELMT